MSHEFGLRRNNDSSTLPSGFNCCAMGLGVHVFTQPGPKPVIAAGPPAAMTGLGPEVPRPSDRTGVCGVGRVRLQRVKRPLKMVFDRQIRRMNGRNCYVPCQIRGRLLAERPLWYFPRSEVRSSGKCRFIILAEISAPMTGRCFASRRGDMP